VAMSHSSFSVRDRCIVGWLPAWRRRGYCLCSPIGTASEPACCRRRLSGQGRQHDLQAEPLANAHCRSDEDKPPRGLFSRSAERIKGHHRRHQDPPLPQDPLPRPDIARPLILPVPRGIRASCILPCGRHNHRASSFGMTSRLTFSPSINRSLPRVRRVRFHLPRTAAR